MSRLGALLTLQTLDARIVATESDVTALTAALARDTELERRRERARSAAAVRRAAELAARDAEAAVTDVRHRAQHIEKRLYGGSVGNPQELMGMQNQLAAVGRDLQVRETELLERMEESDAAETDLVVAREQLAMGETQRAAALGPLGERVEAARHQLNELAEAREDARAALDDADLRTYERVGARRQPAVVRLDGDSCGGCHLPLGISEVHQVRGGDLVQCSNCDRILVP